jgi:predicted GIY-YIG superfamily endonuclease
MITLYVLRGMSGRRYVGITNDLERRLTGHRSTDTSASRLSGEFQILHTEEYPDHAQAQDREKFEREKFLKSGQGRKWLDEHFPRTVPA